MNINMLYTATIVFKKHVETPFKDNIARYNDITSTTVEEGCLGIKAALGNGETLHVIPVDNIVIATISEQPENTDEDNDD